MDFPGQIFAILGLRARCFALAATVHCLKCPKYTRALLLLFAGAKVVVVGIIDSTPVVTSPTVTFGLIAGGVPVSLWKTCGQPAVVEAT